MSKRKIAILAGVVVVLALVCILIVANGGGIAAAQSAATATPLPPVNAGSEVIVDGKVVPNQSAELSFPAGGIVAEVSVQEGDSVMEGQVLAYITGREQAEAEMAAARMELLSAQQALTDLQRNASVLKAQAALKEATARKTMEDERTRVWDPNTTQERQRLKDAKKWLEDSYSRFMYLRSINNGTTTSQNLMDGAYLEYIKALHEYQDAQGDYEDATRNGGNGANTAEADISRARFDLAKAEWESALAELDRLKEEGPQEELSLAAARVKNAEKRSAAAEAGLKNLELRAPFAGRVISVDLRRGEFVAPGAVAITVADVSTWQIETTDLNETDVVRVKVGDSAIITLDAIPGLELAGKVIRVSPLGKNYQGEIVYTVVIQLDQPNDQLRWNMTAMVKIP